MKRVVVVGTGVLGLLVLGTLAYVLVRSDERLSATWETPSYAFVEHRDSVSLAEGERLARAWGCVDCHGDDLGGAPIFEDSPMGRLWAPNLTTGEEGALTRLGEDEFVRAVRHGVRPDGTSMMVMPSEDYFWMSDADLNRIVSWIRTVPPVDAGVPEREVGPAARVALATGASFLKAERVPHHETRPSVPERGATVEYGGYLANACAGCHGAAFAGGIVEQPGTPPSSNLTPAGPIADWTLEEFDAALRGGVRPDGTRLDESMPARAFVAFEDDEVEALWRYFRSLPPRATGENDRTE